MDETTKIGRVAAAAEQVLTEFPDGIRFVDLIQRVRDLLPEWKDSKGLPQYIQWLPRRNPEKFFKPSRGVFQLVDQSASPDLGVIPDSFIATMKDPSIKSWNEASFYQPFADYLINDLDECGKAIVLGGNKFGSKWGTPDVIGVTIPGLRDIYKPPIEIVSVEIKTNANDLVVAFGQACSYQLFSHKTYIVVPSSAKVSDLERLENLCQVFGIGLVLIGSLDPASPGFQLRVRALRREPEPFYVNENLRIVSEELFDT
jgi:hypothetical protein